ncbi:hypothetical protein [Mycoplasmopsis felifaucium]|uniref:Lipoprotein n=1 Tax=Mycoplasmopsis felifaucium TaxID=35768 RepID=A0ABZ2RRR1_9BACT|nr:hypothetical protein [Mycoplasmopsis felifaucium]
MKKQLLSKFLIGSGFIVAPLFSLTVVSCTKETPKTEIKENKSESSKPAISVDKETKDIVWNWSQKTGCGCGNRHNTSDDL